MISVFYSRYDIRLNASTAVLYGHLTATCTNSGSSSSSLCSKRPVLHDTYSSSTFDVQCSTFKLEFLY